MNRPERPAWSGRTVVCIASGPSLTAEDCEKVRESGHPTIVTNTTFRIAPWAHVLFGMDMKWWQAHHKEVSAVFTGRKLSTSHATRAYGAESLYQVPWFTRSLNSGEGAILLAMASGSKRIVLLGFDCQKTGGKTHWHGDHAKGLGNAGSMVKWPKHFAHLSKQARQQGIVILNATRETALTCFERVDLESAL
jgi:hypothetical protein